MEVDERKARGCGLGDVEIDSACGQRWRACILNMLCTHTHTHTRMHTLMHRHGQTQGTS